MANPNRPRNPHVALAMSFMLPGFGQMYNGELNRAIWLFLGFALLSIPGLATIALYLPSAWMMPALVIAVILTLSIWVFAMIDAWRGARRKRDYVPRAWQLSGIYALTLLLCDALALPLLADHVREHQVASFRIPTTSMVPGLLPGDILFADKRYNCPGCKGAVRRGDIAIFADPNNRTRYYIKRVIALPGDRVRIEGRAISVNGKPLTVLETNDPPRVLVTEAIDGRQWQVQWTPVDNPPPDSELTVAPGHAFVLGDNRSGSVDARNFGPVPLQDIVGKARQIWFSAGSPAGIRWERLGKAVD